MKATKLAILLLIISSNCFSQSKKELENQLHQAISENQKLKIENLSLKKGVDSLQNFIGKLKGQNNELAGKLANTETSIKALESKLIKQLDNENNLPQKENHLKQTPTATNTSPVFTIKNKKDISFAGKSKMVYRIILNNNTLPSELVMKNIGNQLWKDGNTKWNDFTVFIYLTGMNSTGAAYGVCNFNEKGLINFMTNKYSLYGTKWEKYAEK